ncbi:hypothetical protein [Chryseobacterium caseinilyticum]|uniref:Uncharacterized protein n=1 Tax=Chryseobacterium caseinilyticum TaxID=2771428 RepID=A0ABR8ZF34_9FLAO|nr:hypothetical protein [Chryseobacterium caseinilyticum]MBD8083899.1 hypothetical protein [Chryseobacterium caseinilyticum]
MKKYSLFFTGIIFSVMSLQCTNKEMTIDESFAPPSAERLNALFDQGVTNEKAFAHFDSSLTNYIYTTARGTTVKVNGTCLRLNGAPITGTVILEFVEIYDRAKMMASNKPTMGKKVSGEQEMLLSGGEFYINIKKDGNTLTTTCPIVVETSTANSGGTVAGMQAFNGVIANSALTWEPTTSWDVVTNVQTNPNKYVMALPGFGWFNCDKFSNYPEPKTTITANVPAGYGSASQVFILAKNIPNALGTTAGKFPVGMQCYLIFVSESNGNFMWIIKEQTLAASHTIYFDLKDAKMGKSADFVSNISQLN